MELQICSELIEDYLKCQYKTYLRISYGNQGKKTDYELMLIKSRKNVSDSVTKKISMKNPCHIVRKDIELTEVLLKNGYFYLLMAKYKNDFNIRFDGLMKVEGKSRIGNHHYIPIYFYGAHRILTEQKLLLDLLGFYLSKIQGVLPNSGIIYYGKNCSAKKVKLFTNDIKITKRLYEQLNQILSAEYIPTHIINNHCNACEYNQLCSRKAIEEDNISLIRRLGPKTIKANHSKGIFTLTQFAYTFRPRRKGRRSDKRKNRYYPLQAMAIRDNRIYVYGSPNLPNSGVKIYFDIEGIPDEGYVYLIGMIIDDGVKTEQYSFWADSIKQQKKILYEFLKVVNKYNNFDIFCYGAYEKRFLNKMKKSVRKKILGKIENKLNNILQIIFLHFYFPTYSNGLKEISGFLGYKWSEKKASGLQSIVWRKRWEATKDEKWKKKLLVYNIEDCIALKKVTNFILITVNKTNHSDSNLEVTDEKNAIWINELDKLTNSRVWGKVNFFHSDYKLINDFSYFDYQRQRVFIRTSKTIRKNTPKKYVRHNHKIRINKKIMIEDKRCPFCKSDELVRDIKGTFPLIKRPRVRRAFDLVVTQSGLKRKVVECRSSIHQCQQCKEFFVPDSYERLDMHFHGLKSWVLYMHIKYRISFGNLEKMCKEQFGLKITRTQLHMIKSLMARFYRTTYRKIIKKILSGPVIHIDETEVNLKNGKGYIWILASIEEAYYMYKANRKGKFLKKFMEDFQGVLISDFYSAYDSIECTQQKCLIHLIRDMNQELLKNPYDEEVQVITESFGRLLRSIVEAVDKNGLKKRYLKKYGNETKNYWQNLSGKNFKSDTALNLQKRLLKNRDKLFTFINFDGVPWNNNCAENSIKQFAYYRAKTKSTMNEAGLNDYLVMLSIFQTCRYKRIDFFQYLLSQNRDIDSYCNSKRKKRHNSQIELYPKGFTPPYIQSLRKHTAKGVIGKQ